MGAKGARHTSLYHGCFKPFDTKKYAIFSVLQQLPALLAKVT